MASYVPPKKNTAYITYIALASQANANTFQAAPTLAAGDFKVSIDGGALANLTTLPTVTPAAGKMVKISLSAAEMNGDNITVVASDASGAEWRDVVLNIQTSGQQVDDLATQTSVNTIDDFLDTELPALTTAVGVIDDFLDTEIAAIKAKTDNLPAAPAATGDIPSAATIAAAVWDRLTSALTTVGSIGKLLVDNVNATISSRSSQTSQDLIDDFLDTEVAAIKAKTDLIPAAPAAVGDIPTATAIADAVLDEAMTEPTAAFTWGGATLRTVVPWLGAMLRNKMTQTATTGTLRNDADSGNISTSTNSDDGTTFTRGEWS